MVFLPALPFKTRLTAAQRARLRALEPVLSRVCQGDDSEEMSAEVTAALEIADPKHDVFVRPVMEVDIDLAAARAADADFASVESILDTSRQQLLPHAGRSLQNLYSKPAASDPNACAVLRALSRLFRKLAHVAMRHGLAHNDVHTGNVCVKVVGGEWVARFVDASAIEVVDHVIFPQMQKASTPFGGSGSTVASTAGEGAERSPAATSASRSAGGAGDESEDARPIFEPAVQLKFRNSLYAYQYPSLSMEDAALQSAFGGAAERILDLFEQAQPDNPTWVGARRLTAVIESFRAFSRLAKQLAPAINAAGTKPAVEFAETAVARADGFPPDMNGLASSLVESFDRGISAMVAEIEARGQGDAAVGAKFPRAAAGAGTGVGSKRGRDASDDADRDAAKKPRIAGGLKGGGSEIDFMVRSIKSKGVADARFGDAPAAGEGVGSKRRRGSGGAARSRSPKRVRFSATEGEMASDGLEGGHKAGARAQPPRRRSRSPRS